MSQAAAAARVRVRVAPGGLVRAGDAGRELEEAGQGAAGTGEVKRVVRRRGPAEGGKLGASEVTVRPLRVSRNF